MLMSVFFFEHYINMRNRVTILNFSEDQIVTASPDYWLSIPKSENPSLHSDLNSTTFNDGDNSLYIIVPNDADLSNIVCYVRDNIYNAYLTKLTLDLTSDIQYAGRTIKAVRLNLPVAYISVDDSVLSYNDMILSNDKANICEGTVIFINNSEDEVIDERKHDIKLSMRGAGYQFNDKKSLTLAFNKSTELLNMGKQKKYNLLSNNSDPSLLKTELFLKMADRFGLKDTPKAANISLFVDGNYVGVYTLTTKVSVGKNKINISKDDYLINFGGTNPVNPVLYDSETYFCDGDLDVPYFDVCYPENLKNTSEIQNAVQRFITSTEDVTDSTYKDYMDIDDMIRYYWVQEVSMNFDACFRSTYATYNHIDKKIHMGPLWDVDLTLGSNFEKEGIYFNTPDGWRIRNMSWYPRLFARDEFSQAANDIFINDNYAEILDDMSDYIKDREEFMAVDGELNLRLYRDIELSNILQERRWYYYEFADSIRDFYDQRIKWIEDNVNPQSN